MPECKICGKQFKVLNSHLRCTHSITAKEYYDKYIKKDGEGICLTCGKNTTFVSLSKGYREHCCNRCAQLDTNVIEKIKNTFNNKYGTDYALQSAAVRQKIYNTCIEKYGVKTPSSLESVKQKAIETCLKNNGVQYPMQSQEIHEKSVQTCLKNNGVEYGFIIPSVLNTTTKSSHSESANLKRKNTCVEKYGVPYYCMTNNCKISGSNDSSYNKQFKQLLIKNNLFISDEDSREFRLGNYSYDFIVDKVLFEINPYSTHNITFNPFGRDPIDKNYHLEKTKFAKKFNYNCINIWDWDDKEKIVNFLINYKTSIQARKCIIKNVSSQDAENFLNKYHFQNYVKDDIRLGLYYQNELVSIMTFGKPRYNKNYEYELLRYCSNCKVIGGAQKLFKYFIINYSPKSIISYCDLSKFNGDVYFKLGFYLKQSKIKPSKHWYNPRTKKHITDNLLRQRGFDQLFGTNYGKGTNNEELMRQYGFVEIYDAGQATYIWKNKEITNGQY